jgi:hypothetical protein
MLEDPYMKKRPVSSESTPKVLYRRHRQQLEPSKPEAENVAAFGNPANQRHFRGKDKPLAKRGSGRELLSRSIYVLHLVHGQLLIRQILGLEGRSYDETCYCCLLCFRC